MPPGMIELTVSLIVAIFASSGFWTYIQSRRSNKDSRLELLLGLAHDRIIHVGKGYVQRGYITYDEYEDFQKYLYRPYAKFGGNGLAEKMNEEVQRLPHVPPKKTEMEIKNEQQRINLIRTDPYCLNFEPTKQSDV